MNTRSILKVKLVAGLLSVTSTVYAAEDTWTKKANMPTPRYGHSASVVNGKIYVIGGAKTSDGSNSLSTVEEYDPAADIWTRTADMPTARVYHSASVVDGKIYVIGGAPQAETDTAIVEEYDPATDTWTRKADMPTARMFLSTCAVDGKIYAIGGRVYPQRYMVSKVEVYDPATDTWTEKAHMLKARGAHAASVVDGKIYAIGGGVDPGMGVPTVHEYDPVTDTWTTKVDMPTTRAFLSTCVVDGKIYAIGGATDTTVVYSTMEQYDPATDSWTSRAEMPTARRNLSASVVAGRIYAIGGSVQAWPWVACSTVEEHDPIVVDFNKDETVNFEDFCTLAQYWHQDQSPFGPRRVDHKYLAVLADYWLKEVLPFSLIAYWKLDETEGLLAHDSAGGHDGVLSTENPLWRPQDGVVNGALELDGIDDCLRTPFVLDPGDGPFSVFAWVRGGAPGQVIISQAGTANWLLVDSTSGTLMTELKSGMLGKSLSSQAVITDGDWHNVGLTWNKPDRILYVDYSEVAKDTQSGVSPSDAGLNIGAGKDLGAGSFFCGLIDDVRIYSRAVTP